jgi:transposase
MLTQQNTKPKLFIGLDIHRKSWSVSMRTDIAEHKTHNMPPDAEQLYAYVDKHFSQHQVSLTYEAGCCGFSAARHLMHLGWELTVVNPADVPIMHKQTLQKTDKIDSRNLCKQLQMGNLRKIYVPTEAHEQFRSLLRHRMQISKDLRRAKSQIKAMLLFHGVETPPEHDNSHWTLAFRKWLKKIKWSNACGTDSMKLKIENFEYHYKQYKEVGTKLRAYAKKTYPKEYPLLCSVPGIGGFTAAAFLAEVGDFGRFNNEGEFSSYLGVVPGIYNSGATESTKGVTPRANHVLRPLLVESVWVAVSKDPEIQAYYRSHIGKNPKSIVVKIAHKMARRILSVIKTGVPYIINNKLELDNKLQLPPEATDILNDATREE